MFHLTALTIFGLALIVGQENLPALSIRPNLVLVIAIYAGQFYQPITGLLISFILGYFLDLISGGLLGLNAFSMVSVCYLAVTFSKRIAVHNTFPRLLTVFSFYMIYGGITYFLFSFFNFDINGYSHIRNNVADGSAAAILSFFIVSVIKKMEKFCKFKNKRAESPGDLRI